MTTIRPLVALDFDGTLADTATPSPNNINVETATERAVFQTFGGDGLEAYRRIGGLKNREPGELVRAISTLLLRGGVLTKDELRIITNELVANKLAQYDISETWPRLYPGVKEFFQEVASGKLPVTTALVSSGHEDFIKQVFEINGLQLPDIIITSDTLRDVGQPSEDRPLFKPSPYTIARAHLEWLKKHGVLPKEEGNVISSREKPYMLYIGDDPIKDGGLAARSRIPFGFVPFSKPGFPPDPARGQFLLPDFHCLTATLGTYREELQEGISLSQLFLGRPYNEVFPLPIQKEGIRYNTREQLITHASQERRG